jgi:hypothetical protein
MIHDPVPLHTDNIEQHAEGGKRLVARLRQRGRFPAKVGDGLLILAAANHAQHDAAFRDASSIDDEHVQHSLNKIAAALWNLLEPLGVSPDPHGEPSGTSEDDAADWMNMPADMHRRRMQKAYERQAREAAAKKAQEADNG